MSFFDTFKERATDLAQTGVAKSKELAEIGKLKLDNAAEEDAIKRAYIEIGKLYYAERGMTPDAAYASLCEKITASKAVIESNNARADEIRAAGNVAAEPVSPIVTEIPAEEPVAPVAPEAPVAPAAEDDQSAE